MWNNNSDSLAKQTGDVLKSGNPTSIVGAIATGAIAVAAIAIKVIGDMNKR